MAIKTVKVCQSFSLIYPLGRQIFFNFDLSISLELTRNRNNVNVHSDVRFSPHKIRKCSVTIEIAAPEPPSLTILDRPN